MTFPEILDKFKNHCYIRRKSWSNNVYIHYKESSPLIRQVLIKPINEIDIYTGFNIQCQAYQKMGYIPGFIQLLSNDIRLCADDLFADDWEEYIGTCLVNNN